MITVYIHGSQQFSFQLIGARSQFLSIPHNHMHTITIIKRFKIDGLGPDFACMVLIDTL